MPLPPTFNLDHEKLPLFAYGTLRDPDILRLVLKNADHLILQSAVLQGWRAVFWRGRSYPGIIPDDSASADGALIFGLTAIDWQSLITYEGAEYRLEICHPSSQKTTQQALIFTPLHHHELTTQSWALDDWQRLHKNNFDITENG